MSDAICSVDGCERLVAARGWCRRHYSRWYRHGTSDATNYRSERSDLGLLDWLASHSTRVGECLVWNGPTIKDGYGRTGIDGRQQLIHRAAYVERHGPIPDGLVVMHSCDNPPCWADGHLSLGTDADNNADMLAKRRHWAHSKTHCRNGHELTPENTVVYAEVRQCRTCKRDANLRSKAKRREARHASTPTA